jgi:uncharacterized protein (TIGR02246 family)
MTCRSSGALVALLVQLAACRPAGGSAPHASDDAPPLAAADLGAIRALDSAFAGAAKTGDPAAVAALYLADASLMPPNARTVEGREAIQKFWGGLSEAYQLSIEVAADEIEGRGDLAYARGHFTLVGDPKGKGGTSIRDNGKFLEVLRRQPDGSWKYAVDMYSSDLPATK